MADSQLFSGAVSLGSADYLLDSEITFVLKAVHAEFDGSGASAAWLPAVIITSDSGHTVARAVDQSVLVQAGDSAEASFFPGVKHAPSASVATDFPWIRRRKLGAADQAFASAVEPTVTWNSTHNDYPAIFAAGVLGVQVLVDGLYSIVCRLFLNTVVGNLPAELYFNNIDSDQFGRYPCTAQFPLYSGMLHGSTDARLVAGSDIYVTCRQESGNLWTLAGNDGCYLELRRLGDSTVVDTFG